MEAFGGELETFRAGLRQAKNHSPPPNGLFAMVFLLISFLLGVLLGVLLQRLFHNSTNETALQAENESLQVELETLRSQVDGHFATSAVMFQNLTEEYRKLLQHMAQGAQSLEVELPTEILADFSVIPPLNQLPEDIVDLDNQIADETTLAEQPEVPSVVSADTDPETNDAPCSDDQDSSEQVLTQVETDSELDPPKTTKTTG